MTLPNEGSGTEPVLEQSEEHDKEQLSSSFVPAAPRQATERKAVEQVVSGEQPVAWPPRGDTPLNEFHSDGYVASAFAGSIDRTVDHLCQENSRATPTPQPSSS